MTRVRALCAVGVVVAGLLLTGCSSSAAGQCAWPVASVAPTAAAPGERIELHGAYWQVCNDTGGNAPAWRSVSVQWSQNGRTAHLGIVRVDGDTDGVLSGVIEVPQDAPPGDAVVRVSGPEGVSVDVPVTVAAPPA